MTSSRGMNVLVAGSGAREHAIVWKLLQSPRVKDVYIAPGNAGTGLIARNLPIQVEDHDGLRKAARQHQVDLTVIGPEAPLAQGIVDYFKQSGLRVFGPTRQAARIESSKAFAKDLLRRHGIPCAQGEGFTDPVAARDYLYRRGAPIVVKADGLAAGKGVVVCQTLEEAEQAVDAALSRRVFGNAGDTVVIEEYLEGQEVSALAFTDGECVLPMEPASDYKRALDADQGPNTGGMGAYSPPAFFGPELRSETLHLILEPAVRALKAEGCPFVGCLYAGLMVTDQGVKVVEFNARFGDPETQVVLPRLQTDLVDVLEACIDGRLSQIDLQWDPRPCVGVVVASGGYPELYQTGFPITGLDAMEDGIRVFHAGTAMRPLTANRGLRRLWATDLPSPGVDVLLSGDVVTAGGRVLTVVAMGDTVEEARLRAYNNVARVEFTGAQYRRDIASPETMHPPAPGTAPQAALPPGG